jgi:hypothetical protein
MITAPLGKAVNSQNAPSWLLPKAWDEILGFFDTGTLMCYQLGGCAVEPGNSHDILCAVE